jgi:hypothetical protein
MKDIHILAYNSLTCTSKVHCSLSLFLQIISNGATRVAVPVDDESNKQETEYDDVGWYVVSY